MPRVNCQLCEAEGHGCVITWPVVVRILYPLLEGTYTESNGCFLTIKPHWTIPSRQCKSLHFNVMFLQRRQHVATPRYEMVRYSRIQNMRLLCAAMWDIERVCETWLIPIRFPRVVFYPFNQNDDAWNNGSHGRRGCFFHCAVVAADHLHGHWWGTDGSWCKSIFHRGTACADIWSQEVVPRETQELGLPSDGHVCLREAKHQVDNIDLGKFNAMMPIVQLLSTVDQCCQEFVGIDDVAKFIDGQCHDSSDGHRLAFMITLDGKWSVAVRSSTSLHLLHFDPHVVDDAHLDQSLLAVLRDGADLVQIMMRRGAYFPESRGAVSPGA